jgi:hypothetical protein
LIESGSNKIDDGESRIVAGNLSITRAEKEIWSWKGMEVKEVEREF